MIGRRGGFSLLEVMIAAFLLIIVFFGLAQIYTRSRTQIDYEEDRRKATAVAQARLDGIRRDYTFDTISELIGRDTTIVSDRREYDISHFIFPHYPDSHAVTCSLIVAWTASVAGTDVERTLEATTILGRSITP
jgi:type II secretory pathway pseudopilin PulG